MISRYPLFVFPLMLVALVLLIPLSSATTCRDFNISAPVYDMNYTFVKYNFTGISFSAVGDVRIYNKSCFAGGGSVPFNVTRYGSDNLEVFFRTNQNLSKGNKLGYSIEYDTGLSGGNPDTKTFWRELFDGRVDGLDLVGNIVSSGTASRFKVSTSEQACSHSGNNALLYHTGTAGVIPTVDFCFLYRYNYSNDATIRDLFGIGSSTAPNLDDVADWLPSPNTVQVRSAESNIGWFTGIPDEKWYGVQQCVWSGGTRYKVYNSTGHYKANVSAQFNNNSGSLVGVGWYEADLGGCVDEWVMTTDINARIYSDYPTIQLGEPQQQVLTNSSWNVTSFTSVLGNSSLWNTKGTVRLKSNLLSFSVSTSQSTNMSCRLDVEGNYSEIVAYDSRTKSATTETTSHAMTIFENMTQGSHNLYCSFITSSGQGTPSGVSLSGALPVFYERVNTSISHFGIDRSFFVFDSDTFIPVINRTFILTSARKGIISTSFNVHKSTLPQETDVYTRVSVNGVPSFSGRVRTVSGLGDYGSVNLPDISALFSSGSNTLSFEFYDTGPGSVNVSFFHSDIVLNNTQGSAPCCSLTKVDNGSSPVLSTKKIADFSLDVVEPTPVYFTSRVTVWNGTSGAVDCFINSSDNKGSSGIVRRSFGTGVGSVGFSWVAPAVLKSNDYGLYCYSNSSVAVNGSLSALALLDGGERVIHSFYGSNRSINVSSPVTLGAGTHILSIADNFTVRNGTGVFGNAFFSAESLSGSQRPLFFISTNVSGCSGQHWRSFSSSGEIGSVSVGGSCNNSFESIRVESGVTVESGESLRIYEEGLSLVEIFSVNTNITNQPPEIVILSPVNGSNVFGVVNVSWVVSDERNDNYLVNITVSNSSNSYKVVNNTLNFGLVNFSLFGVGDYLLTAIVWENESNELFVSNDSIIVSNIATPVYVVDITLLTPLNNSALNVRNVSVSFSVSNVTNCTLLFNSSALEDFSEINGVAVSSAIVLSNRSVFNWTVNCTGGTTPLPYFFNTSYDNLGSVVSGNACPDTFDSWIVFIVMFFLCVCFIVGGFLFRIPILSFGSFLIMGTVFIYLYSCLWWFFILMGILSYVSGVILFIKGVTGD